MLEHLSDIISTIAVMVGGILFLLFIAFILPNDSDE